jgi:membrane fusion protein, copper/silver efflux system
VCELSGMPLVSAEELGYVTDLSTVEPPLVVPASSPLITGRRAVVYIREPGTEKPTFEGREVVLGPRAGNWYIVSEGLREGEQVVVNGAFKIDSAMQLAAKPSMIDAGGAPPPGHDHGSGATPRSAPRQQQQDVPEEFLFSLKPVYGAYIAAQQALANDDLAGFQTAAADLRASLQRVRIRGVVGEPLGLWRRLQTRLGAGGEHIVHTDDIEAARATFEHWSHAIFELVDRFGHLGTVPYYRAYCPMAFDDKGAEWLQIGQTINNPYFGESMLLCGEIRGRFDPRGQREVQR